MATMWIWDMRVHAEKNAEFNRLLRDEVIPLLRAQEGVQTLHVGHAGPDRYLIVSIWADPKHIEVFGGEGWTVARSWPAVRDLLRERARVTLYDTISEELSDPTRGAQ